MSTPNIVYIHSHDTGRYIGPYGHAIGTPNLQRFAEQGSLFRQAFCAAPTCSPSRAALLTGQSPHSAGMLGLAHRGHRLTDYQQHIIHTLHPAGYTSAIAGIQHIAKTAGVGRQDIGYHHDLTENTHEEAAHAAARFLKQGHDRPFFLDVGFSKTHRTHKEGESVQWHNHEESPLGEPRYCRPPAPLPDTPRTRQDMADYIVCAQRLDAQIGVVLDAIDQAGLAENTLVIITTDHGIAFPGMKCSLTDHGMGVMLMMRGPAEAGFTPGQVIDGLASHIDLFPTICELLGLDKPDWLQGTSVMPLIRQQAEQVSDAVFSEVTHHAAYEPKRAVRTTRWKYIRRFDRRNTPVLPNCDDSVSKTLWHEHGWSDQPLETEYLYDLVFDPNEACNLADSPRHESALRDMRRRLDEWMQRTDDPLRHGPLDDLPDIIATPQDAYSPTERP